MFNLLATPDVPTVLYVAVSILLGLAIIATFISQIFVAVGYWKGNRTDNSLGLTGGELARKLLDENGMPDVEVKKCTFLRTLFFGNHYSISKKTIYLRMLTINKTSLTSAAMAVQKVALAEQHRDGDKKMILRSRLQGLAIFAPALFVPLVAIGLILDLFVLQTVLLTIVALILGLVFIAFGFVVTLLNIPVERKAIKRAEQMIDEKSLLTAEESLTVKKIYRSYMVQYVMQFVVAVLRILQLILKIFAKSKNR